MNQRNRRKYVSFAVACWLAFPFYTAVVQGADTGVTTKAVQVKASKAQEEAKFNSQQVSIITKDDIEKKQAKSVEDIIFTETGVSRTVDSMGRVGVSIRGAEPRHTLILVDGQPVLGDLAKFSGAADEVMRLGTENVERIEVVQGSASAKYGSDAIGGVINIITKKASKKARLQFNAEGARAVNGETGLPYKNIFMRADSGQMGKVRVAISGSKRDIMPVLATEGRTVTSIDPNNPETKAESFKPNALRFYGTAADLGVTGTVDINKENSLEFRVNHYNEDLTRDVKHTDSSFEPQQHFKRESDRNTYNMIWNGRGGNSDWKLEANYSRITENDVSLINYQGRSDYEGKNELKYIDDIDHRQKDFRLTTNSTLNEQHTLTWGGGITKEEGSGSRLKSSPITRTRYIDPWDFDKNLLVDGVDRLERKRGDTSLRIYSHIHDFKFKDNVHGLPQWDKDYEYYGAKSKDEVPPITYEYYREHNLDSSAVEYISDYYNNLESFGVTKEKWEDLRKFEKELKEQNPNINGSSLYKKYFDQGESIDPEQRNRAPVYNREYVMVNDLDNNGNIQYNADGTVKQKKQYTGPGSKFLQNYRERDQRITEGEGSITKKNFFVQDSWQLNKDTILAPTLRFDNSSLFGSHWSWNMGVTHNVGSNPHRRLKANVGTGYSEPGMGELWYNWEMFGSNPVAQGLSKMGWYWAGNPNLKPETSRNFDLSIEGENNKTYGRVGVFHNKIKNYMSVYFTGDLMDFAPDLPLDQKWLRAPDLIYSFKNIGLAEITGLQAEWRQKYNKHWSTRVGYTWLHAINKSDPTMPHKLLDRPTHKLDLGVTYETEKWNASLWADYYIRMLDSNTQANGGNYWTTGITSDSSVFNANNEYQEKTFGIWNAMIQRKFSKDTLMYFGINNIFNHHDDDRATQSRVYRFGINLKFGADGKDDLKKDKKTGMNVTKHADGTALSGNAMASGEAANMNNGFATPVNGMDAPLSEANQVAANVTVKNDFLARPFDETKKEGVEFIGDVRTRMDSHEGINRSMSRYNGTSYVDTAERNLADKPEHRMENRIRAGFEARVGENTNIKVLGSASGSKLDTASSSEGSKGFNNQKLDTLDVTQKANKWDFSVGRLQEKMGTTGYWFNKEFDGVRAVWTDQKNQFRVGYGSFKRNTGITDSAYSHSEYSTFYRPPTVDELLGVNVNSLVQSDSYDPFDVRIRTGEGGRKVYDEEGKLIPADSSPLALWEKYKDNPNVYFYEQLKSAFDDAYEMGKDDYGYDALVLKEGKTAEGLAKTQGEILGRLQDIVRTAYGDTEEFRDRYVSLDMPTNTAVIYKIADKSGHEYHLRTTLRTSAGRFDPKDFQDLVNSLKGKTSLSITDSDAIRNPQAWVANNTDLMNGLNTIAAYNAQSNWADYLKLDELSNGTTWGGVTSYQLANDGTLTTAIIPKGLKPTDFTFEGVTHIVSGINTSTKTYDTDNLADQIYKLNFVKGNQNAREYEMEGMGNMLYQVWKEIFTALPQTEQGNAQPRAAFEKLVGKPILTTGLTLKRDNIPHIDKAIFAQYKHQVNDKLGLQAWFLRSVNNNNHTFSAGHYSEETKKVRYRIGSQEVEDKEADPIYYSWDTEKKYPRQPMKTVGIYEDFTFKVKSHDNDVYRTNRLANVFAIGAQYRMGDNALLSVDYGQNRSDFGRYMNGHTNYDHVRGTADFTLRGHSMGGVPHFFTARLDIGQSDFERKGSWNAFLDYKYFAHGSFFGGNGTGAVPDRYLDGIRSFTLGGGYVPTKNLLLEAFYTFDAKGIGKRDTLYGAENFKLGNYTRIQGTYRF